ncbi:hypothetical protein P154DRAFT_578574 [Amniculicola lignicola CBS 123094]|uniref:Uncharacterized protein n=1 Tax=Amniculicola lignicola CBS 123094 TaxID=1392246 RepID=A0A6A5W7B4_9PLEO|nr:hypothetical protein P154DRAFT_578574 [Amniculicola lignicola CBS 123094]
MNPSESSPNPNWTNKILSRAAKYWNQNVAQRLHIHHLQSFLDNEGRFRLPIFTPSVGESSDDGVRDRGGDPGPSPIDGRESSSASSSGPSNAASDPLQTHGTQGPAPLTTQAGNSEGPSTTDRGQAENPTSPPTRPTIQRVVDPNSVRSQNTQPEVQPSPSRTRKGRQRHAAGFYNEELADDEEEEVAEDDLE